MKIDFTIKMISSAVFLFIFTACQSDRRLNVLEQAGENYVELEKVLQHYKDDAQNVNQSFRQHPMSTKKYSSSPQEPLHTHCPYSNGSSWHQCGKAPCRTGEHWHFASKPDSASEANRKCWKLSSSQTALLPSAIGIP